MKKIIFGIVVFSFTQMQSTHSQVPTLEMLDDILINENNQEIQDPNQDKQRANQLDDQKEKDEERNFEDENYGYTGGKDFTTVPQERFYDEPLKYFGYDFFSNAPSTYAQLDNIPVPPDYVLGPGDMVKVYLFGNQNKRYNLEITRDGQIFIPELGPIDVIGLKFTDFINLIESLVTKTFIGTDVSVTLGSVRSIDIFVLGEAYKPGMYTVSALSSLTNAIFKSGGIKTTGSLRNIQLKRAGRVVSQFDFYDLLLNGDTSKDQRLLPGDVVFIPATSKTIGILGEIGRSGIYELKENEGLDELIKFSGNLKPKADKVSADLKRIDYATNGFKLIPIDIASSSKDFDLENGDVISIYPVADNLNNAILLSGHALKPGFIPWKEGMRLGQVIKSPEDLLSMTDLNYVLVKRKDPITQKYMFYQSDLEKLFNGNTNENIVLAEKDEIILFPSLLMPQQITTKVIKDDYVFNQEINQNVLKESEWTSLTQLRKSVIKDQNREIKNSRGNTSSAMNLSSQESQDGERLLSEDEDYFEYSIFDYCTIPKDLASYAANSVNDLVDEEIVSKKNSLEKTRIQDNYDLDIAMQITEICRKQLLEPILDIAKRQNTTSTKENIINIFGNVYFPDSYPFTQGMELADALSAAGGLKNSTYDGEIEINRIASTGKQFVNKSMSVKLSDPSSALEKLEEMDTITIKQLKSGIKTVKITGEVYFPGTYPISDGQSIRTLIQRAGGITEMGSIDAAFFQRESIKEIEINALESARSEISKKIALLGQTNSLGSDSSDNQQQQFFLSTIVNDDIDYEKVLGRMVIDLNSILQGNKDDLVLEDMDSLHIPKISQSVSVIGEVFVPSSHVFNKQLTIQDYLDLSGGINTFADAQSIYLIKSSGSIVPPSKLGTNSGFFRGGTSVISAGDTIVVPLELKPFSGIQATNEVSQIIYQLAIAAAAVNSF